ncbi:MAG: Transcriptional regulator [Myxococcaceae bacterium]|nr:Transcriptional regulator [Myxococcaceae bacterium]
MAAKKRRAAPKQQQSGQVRPTVSESDGDDLGAAEMNRRVADALKRLRRERALSLDELALKSGVSRAALSQIEGARTNPTLTVLWKVASGLGVSFHELLESPRPEPLKTLRASDMSVVRSADGRVESRLLTPGGTTSALETYELRLQPRAIHRSEPHQHGTTEIVIVLKGALRVITGEHEAELASGDTASLLADLPHSYENRSSHETRFINVISYERP